MGPIWPRAPPKPPPKPPPWPPPKPPPPPWPPPPPPPRANPSIGTRMRSALANARATSRYMAASSTMWVYQGPGHHDPKVQLGDTLSFVGSLDRPVGQGIPPFSSKSAAGRARQQV